MRSIRSFFPAIIGGLVLIHPASASISYIGSTLGANGSGDTLSALVTIFLPGETDVYGHSCTGVVGTLCMTLVNTQVGGTKAEADTLGGVYFSVTGSPTLTASSALADTVITPPSTTNSAVAALSVTPQSPVLNGGWALVTTPGTDTVNSNLPKTGYAWATDPNSGSVAASYNVGTDNYSIISGTNVGAIAGGTPVIANELFLKLTGFKSGSTSLALSTISNVVFSWDSTGQFSANGVVTPEPATMGFVGIALIAIVARRKALRRRNSAV